MVHAPPDALRLEAATTEIGRGKTSSRKWTSSGFAKSKAATRNFRPRLPCFRCTCRFVQQRRTERVQRRYDSSPLTIPMLHRYFQLNEAQLPFGIGLFHVFPATQPYPVHHPISYMCAGDIVEFSIRLAQRSREPAGGGRNFLEDPAQLSAAMRTTQSTAGQAVEQETLVHWLVSVRHQIAMSPSHLSA